MSRPNPAPTEPQPGETGGCHSLRFHVARPAARGWLATPGPCLWRSRSSCCLHNPRRSGWRSADKQRVATKVNPVPRTARAAGRAVVLSAMCASSSACLRCAGWLIRPRACLSCFLSHVVPMSLRTEGVCPFVCVLAACRLLVQNGACGVLGRGSGGVQGDLGHVEEGRRPWAGGSEGLQRGGGPHRSDRARGGGAASSTCLLFIAESKILQK